MPDGERDRIFSEWLAGHMGILFKVVHAYAFEHADRQDLFQEVAVQVWRSVDAFRGESSVPTWLYRVALNTAIAWNRKEGKHQRGKQPLAVVEGVLTTESSEGRDPRLEWLYRQIAQLDDQATSVRLASVLVIPLPVFVAATAILLAGMRVNSEPNAPFDDWEAIVGGIFVCAVGTVCGIWEQRRSVKRDVLPRKRRLEALLKELDGHE